MFFIALILIVLAIAGFRFKDYYIDRNYILSVYTNCDASVNNCFVADPEFADQGFQAGAYEKVEITARYAPACLEEHTCQDFSCNQFPDNCSVTYCSDDSIEEGEACSNALNP